MPDYDLTAIRDSSLCELLDRAERAASDLEPYRFTNAEAAPVIGKDTPESTGGSPTCGGLVQRVPSVEPLSPPND
jgi:hypothetical protein